MNYVDFSIVEGDFIRYANSHKKDIKRFPDDNNLHVWNYVYNNDKGIQWRLCFSQSKNGYEAHGITAIINPKVLIENNYIHAAQADDLKLVKEIFNRKLREISASRYFSHMRCWVMNNMSIPRKPS